jgi:small-conductance mechanosensitive channel
MLDLNSLFSIENLVFLITSLAIVLITIILDRVVRNLISKYSGRVNIDKHAENILRITARIIIISVGIVALLQYLGLGVEWFVGVSALTGAAIGFASTQTVGNFLAGLYLMISKPFSVGDYVKIGDIEGEVEVISINYTKIFTPTYNKTEIPNRKVLDSTITNYSTSEDVIDYSFEIEFPLRDTISNDEIIQKCIVPEMEKFYEKYKDVLPRKPEYSMSKLHRFGKNFSIRVFYPEGDVKTFYDIQPELVQNISNMWDKYTSKRDN